MRNPIKKVSEIMGIYPETEIANANDVADIKAVRAVSKLWIVGFGGFAALLGREVVQEGGLPTVSIESSDTTWDAVEFGLDTAAAATLVVPGALSIAGCAEFIRIHKMATERLEQLQPPATG